MKRTGSAAALISWGAGFGANQMFKTRSSEYFKDCPEIKEKIEKKVYTHKEIQEAVLAYNKCKGKN